MDTEKSERQRELEARELVLAPNERQELENLQAAYAAALAGNEDEDEPGQYLLHTIDMEYHPRPVSAEEQARFQAMKDQMALRRPTFWQRIKRRLRGRAH